MRRLENKSLERSSRQGGQIVSRGISQFCLSHPLRRTVLTYKEIIELVLLYTNRWRPIVSIPYGIGTLQGAVLERLPDTMFTITRDQV
jgi:hypothetical protein